MISFMNLKLRDPNKSRQRSMLGSGTNIYWFWSHRWPNWTLLHVRDIYFFIIFSFGCKSNTDILITEILSIVGDWKLQRYFFSLNNRHNRLEINLSERLYERNIFYAERIKNIIFIEELPAIHSWHKKVTKVRVIIPYFILMLDSFSQNNACLVFTHTYWCTIMFQNQSIIYLAIHFKRN